jgi:hypothetical protein
VSSEHDIPAPKIGALQMATERQSNRDLLENGLNDSDGISVVYGNLIPK